MLVFDLIDPRCGSICWFQSHTLAACQLRMLKWIRCVKTPLQAGLLLAMKRNSAHLDSSGYDSADRCQHKQREYGVSEVRI